MAHLIRVWFCEFLKALLYYLKEVYKINVPAFTLLLEICKNYYDFVELFFLLNWLVAITSLIFNRTCILSLENILVIVVLLLWVVFGDEICLSVNWLGPSRSNRYRTSLPSRVMSEAHTPNWNWMVWLFIRVDVSILQWADILLHLVVLIYKNKNKLGTQA